MAPLSFAKLFSQRDSRPSIYPVSSSVSNTPTTGSAFTAEMLEDDNLSWGRPSRDDCLVPALCQTVLRISPSLEAGFSCNPNISAADALSNPVDSRQEQYNNG
ncbi:hypothetical protein PYCCODRAFT_1178528 [Trametes coccinea BRFM310]|uniref:Uncharacterized protein n=1 Tax=Trametes coccinea (strain BRFM310) TaxID=1353009 RepID=A0A1Y2IXD0_TRAC3|nr:hypothetical protein PYCCODRAFT_1178528 [Trametes coccinea BRFM310]